LRLYRNALCLCRLAEKIFSARSTYCDKVHRIRTVIPVTQTSRRYSIFFPKKFRHIISRIYHRFNLNRQYWTFLSTSQVETQCIASLLESLCIESLHIASPCCAIIKNRLQAPKILWLSCVCVETQCIASLHTQN